jgi:D-beta-D-heptose 7-phosphate kinase/D-beta-D-heptose 1-phosphate adenosyltransferase
MNIAKPDYSNLLGAIDFFRNKKILCIGDVMLDRYIYGDVNRISPEAPIPVFSTKNEESMLGAAGNVAKNIAAFGATVEFYSVVGDDKYGMEIKKLLSKENNILSFLTTSGETTVKTRYVASGQQLMRIDNDHLSVPVEIPGTDNFDAVIVSDYDKGACELIDVSSIKVPCIVDTKSWLGNYKGAMVVTPNLGELADSVDWFRQDDNDDDVIEAASEIQLNHNIKNVLVTRASKGMTLVNGGVRHITSTAKEVFDVVGAGDTVAAVMALGLATGLTVYESAIIANVAGGIVVGKRGTATCTPMELKTSILAMMQSALN